jgi:putative transposase
LKQANAQSLQASLKDLSQAYANFFSKKSGFPQFKKRERHESFRFPQGCKLDEPNATIYLPKIGIVRYRVRPVQLVDMSTKTIG